jgi:hypothetical protein
VNHVPEAWYPFKLVGLSIVFVSLIVLALTIRNARKTGRIETLTGLRFDRDSQPMLYCIVFVWLIVAWLVLAGIAVWLLATLHAAGRAG